MIKVNIKEQTKHSPIIIGGSGGSGTRVFTTACIASGYNMGNHLNHAYDAMDFTQFYNEWINPFLLKDKYPLGAEGLYSMDIHFQTCLRNFVTSIQNDEHWGWKNPRSMFLLPFFDMYFPALKFIHIVRDGRDMAYSKNQNQLRKHGDAILEPDQKNLSPQMQSIIFWSKINMITAEYGENIMGNRYLRLRFEDICFNPDGTLTQLAAFLNTNIKNTPNFIKSIFIPKTIGRWRTMHTGEHKALTNAGRKGLNHFKYLDNEPQ